MFLHDFIYITFGHLTMSVVGGVLGLSFVLLFIFLAFVSPLLAKKAKQKEKETTERERKEIEDAARAGTLHEYIREKRKGDMWWPNQSIAFNLVCNMDLDVFELFLYFKDFRVANVQPSWTSREGKTRPLYVTIPSNDLMRELIENAISEGTLYDISFLYFIYYAAKEHPFIDISSSYVRQEKVIDALDDVVEDLKFEFEFRAVRRDEKAVEKAFEDAYKILPCPCLEFNDSSYQLALDSIDYLTERHDSTLIRVPTYEMCNERVHSEGCQSVPQGKKSLFVDELDFEEQCLGGRTVRFYPKEHIYTIDGKRVPTVTEIVKLWSKDNGFWEYGNVSQTVLDRAAAKGTKMHKEIELYETEGIISSSKEFNNYLSEKDYYGFKPLKNEIFIYICDEQSNPVCAGRLDFTMVLNGKLGICDLKRTSNYHAEEVELQLNLYRLGYEQLFGEKIEVLRCLRLRDDISEFNEVPLNKRLARNVIKTYCK